MPDTLLEKTVSFRSDFFEKQGELLEKLAKEGQSPEALFIGCADSRVSPEKMLGANPGDLFMLRNIANIFPPYEHSDTGVTAVLEYAIRHLKVPHLVLCGHTDCGGIKGLDTELDAENEPALTRWLEFARPAQQQIDSSGQKFINQADRNRAIVEQNVVLQLRHIQTYPFVLAALEANRLELHGWVYYMRRRLIGHYEPGRDTFAVMPGTFL